MNYDWRKYCINLSNLKGNRLIVFKGTPTNSCEPNRRLVKLVRYYCVVSIKRICIISCTLLSLLIV